MCEIILAVPIGPPRAVPDFINPDVVKHSRPRVVNYRHEGGLHFYEPSPPPPPDDEPLSLDEEDEPLS